MRQNAVMPEDAVLGIARLAGAAILEIYETDAADGASRLANKADNSPLTLADLAAHKTIATGLAAATPHIPVVSEEDGASGSVRVQAECFWLVDPLDGTKEFLAKNGEFTVNIALIEHGVATWGVVFAPVLGAMYWGGPGKGAMFADATARRSLQVASQPAQADTCRVVASKSHLNEETSDFIAKLGTVDLVQAGSSLKFCRVAEGKAHIYPRLAPTCEWDTAAAQAILEGAGGHVCDLQGDPLRYGKPNVLNPHFVASAVPFHALIR